LVRSSRLEQRELISGLLASSVFVGFERKLERM
jgi:hypothetical protein